MLMEQTCLVCSGKEETGSLIPQEVFLGGYLELSPHLTPDPSSHGLVSLSANGCWICDGL